MKKSLKILVGVFSLLAFGFICSYATYVKETKDNLISQANSQLYDLRYLLDALEYLDNRITDDSILREKLEIALVSNLITVDMIKPKMSDLEGTPLSSLCRAITYKRKHSIGADGLGKYKDKKMAQIVLEYLESIEPELSDYVKTFKSFSIEGCQVLNN
jgi:hypothetical protein